MVTFGKFSTEFETLFENWGKSETEGKCIIDSGGWTPLLGMGPCTVYRLTSSYCVAAPRLEKMLQIKRMAASVGPHLLQQVSAT